MDISVALNSSTILLLVHQLAKYGCRLIYRQLLMEMDVRIRCLLDFRDLDRRKSNSRWLLETEGCFLFSGRHFNAQIGHNILEHEKSKLPGFFVIFNFSEGACLYLSPGLLHIAFYPDDVKSLA